MESKETRSTDNIQPEIAPTPEVIQLAAVLATPDHPADLVRFIANAFGVSRQTVHKHVRRLVDGGDLIAHGKTRARRYTLRDLTQERRELDVTPKLEEDRVWREYILPKLEGVPENIEQICEYGFTEMVNNVVDHSESEKLTIGMTMNMRDIRMFVRDFGVGIFHKIQEELQLHDPRHALLELSKGKLTTDPKRHSGEGIYFTSRAFNEFSISSGELYFQRSLDDNSQ
ncbi:MAG: winged helix-turn-helix domain-containing protein, partial [Myxococcota bacterium]